MTRSLSLCLVVLVAGCGAASQRPQEPTATPQGTSLGAKSGDASPVAPASAQADEPESHTLQMTSWQNQFAQTLADTEGLDCPNACRALGSLERSAANICNLVGEKTSTCQDVQKKSAEAKTRVRDRCGVCP